MINGNKIITMLRTIKNRNNSKSYLFPLKHTNSFLKVRLH